MQAPLTTAMVGTLSMVTLPNIAISSRIKYLMFSILFSSVVYLRSRPPLNILSFKDRVIRQAGPVDS